MARAKITLHVSKDPEVELISDAVYIGGEDIEIGYLTDEDFDDIFNDENGI